MQFYPHRTVEEQANRLPRELRQAYLNSKIDRITIFDGTTELEITGYAEYSYLDEKSYKIQPVRTQDGVIQDIEEYATFLTPRLIIKYNMMHIDDYRSLMKMFKKQNGFVVKCYDVVEDKIVRNEMYVATPSMPIIYQQYLMALGIKEYTIELIGTNVHLVRGSFIGGLPPLLNFDIDGAEFKVHRGQTWEEFAEGNLGVVYIDSTDQSVRYYANDSQIGHLEEWKPVHAEDYVFAASYWTL